MEQVDLTPRRIGRPPTCTCGECRRCRAAAYMRGWWNRQSIEERRARIAKRDPERVAAAERKRSRTTLKQEAIERSRARHPERYAARRAVHVEVAAGRLVRQPCECGANRVEAHHPDYSMPLEVEWLCRRHHVERHAA